MKRRASRSEGRLIEMFAAPGVLVLFVVLKTVGELFAVPFASTEPWRRVPEGQ